MVIVRSEFSADLSRVIGGLPAFAIAPPTAAVFASVRVIKRCPACCSSFSSGTGHVPSSSPMVSRSPDGSSAPVSTAMSSCSDRSVPMPADVSSWASTVAFAMLA